MPAKTRPDCSVQAEQGSNAKYVEHALDMFDWQTPDMRDATAVHDRIIQYFNHCIQDDLKPCVEGLSVAFGVDRRTMWTWVNGAVKYIPQESVDTLKKAYSILNLQLANYANNGQLNPVTAIFMFKNHFGYEDKTEVVVQPGKYDALPDTDKLAQEYIDTIASPQTAELPESAESDK